jgi:hypothetical protein
MEGEAMSRGLEWRDVRGVLDEFGVRYEVDGNGFAVRAPVMFGYRQYRDDWRVRCGSGIGGRGGSWMLVRVHDGESLSRAVSTKPELRRIIREYFAGPTPDPSNPRRYYAAKHRTRFQSGHYIWKRRRVARGGNPP